MAIQIEKYQPRQAVPVSRQPMPDPGTASLLARESAAGLQNASQALLHTYQTNQQLNMQQQHLDVQLERARYHSNVAAQADDARMTYDADAMDFLRDAETQYKNNPGELLRSTQDFLQRRATELATTKYDPQMQTSAPRFGNDPDATNIVRGDLLQRGQVFLDKANALVTKLTLNNHADTLERSQENGLVQARMAGSPQEAAKAIADVTTSFINASGTLLAADKAYDGARQFQDKAWNTYWTQQAQTNPQAFIDRLAIGKPEMQTKEGNEALSNLTYRTMVANPDKVSEVTARNAVQLGVITPENYKAILKAKGFDDDAVKDRMYSVRLSEVQQGKVSLQALPDAITQWATTDGLDRPRVNELKQAALNFADLVTKTSDANEKAMEKQAKANGELVESKVYEMISKGGATIDSVRTLLNESLESKSLTASQKNAIETTAKNMLAAGGPGDGLKRNKFELDIRMNALSHSPTSIRNDKTLNIKEMNELVALQETELGKDKMPAHQKQVYDQERKNVGIRYGDKGPMAQYTTDETQNLVAAYQRYDDLVMKYKLNPRDAYYKLNDELNVIERNQKFRGLSLPAPAQVKQWTDMIANGQPLPQGMTRELIQSYVDQYRQLKAMQDIQAKQRPPQPKGVK